MKRSIRWVPIVWMICHVSGCMTALDSSPSEGTSTESSALKTFDPKNIRAATPPMGWSSWNTFRDKAISEAVVKEQANAMITSGMAAMGYTYVNIDAGWQADQRDPDGTLPPNSKFPDMKKLADWLHARGLKLGIYSSPNSRTCPSGAYPGSKDHEAIDAQQYASWGVDYLKYDRCGYSIGDVEDAFLLMRQSLDATGRTILFSINPDDSAASNEHPELSVSTQHWSNVADVWRTTQDIKPIWHDGNEAWYSGMVDIADDNVEWTRFGSTGAWNDPDMLEVGVTLCTGDDFPSSECPLTLGENRIHMSLWAIMAAPLFAGNNLAEMEIYYPDVKAVLANPEVIAVDQDPIGAPGWRVRDEGDLEVWMRPLQKSGSRAVALVNRSSTRQAITALFPELQLAKGSATVRDLWARTDLGVMSSITRFIPGHDVSLFRVDGVDDFSMFEAESVQNERFGNKVEVTACPACSGALKVGYIGFNSITGDSGAIRVPVNSTFTGNVTLAIYYLSDGARKLTVSANGNTPTTFTLPSTGSFQTVGRFAISLNLNAGRNIIDFYSNAGWAPDIDRIALE